MRWPYLFLHFFSLTSTSYCYELFWYKGTDKILHSLHANHDENKRQARLMKTEVKELAMEVSSLVWKLGHEVWLGSDEAWELRRGLMVRAENLSKSLFAALAMQKSIQARCRSLIYNGRADLTDLLRSSISLDHRFQWIGDFFRTKVCPVRGIHLPPRKPTSRASSNSSSFVGGSSRRRNRPPFVPYDRLERELDEMRAEYESLSEAVEEFASMRRRFVFIQKGLGKVNRDFERQVLDAQLHVLKCSLAAVQSRFKSLSMDCFDGPLRQEIDFLEEQVSNSVLEVKRLQVLFSPFSSLFLNILEQRHWDQNYQVEAFKQQAKQAVHLYKRFEEQTSLALIPENLRLLDAQCRLVRCTYIDLISSATWLLARLNRAGLNGDHPLVIQQTQLIGRLLGWSRKVERLESQSRRFTQLLSTRRNYSDMSGEISQG